MDGLPISADRLSELITTEIDEIKAAHEAWEERIAISAPDDGLTTDYRAIFALERPERFAGEHQVANAWLLNSTTARCWKANGHV